MAILFERSIGPGYVSNDLNSARADLVKSVLGFGSDYAGNPDQICLAVQCVVGSGSFVGGMTFSEAL